VAQSAGVLAGAAALVLSLAPPVLAQSTGRITGVVTDSATDRPVSNVQMVVVGTRIGGVTDAQGRYTIAGAPSGTRSIEARRIGYRVARVPNVSVQDGGTVTVDVKIVAIALTLQAVVTTGVVDPTSGTRVPFTVGRLEVENIPVPSANAIESIQGKVAAVTIVPPGQPGSGRTSSFGHRRASTNRTPRSSSWTASSRAQPSAPPAPISNRSTLRAWRSSKAPPRLRFMDPVRSRA
jgi:hypothetical protein